MRDEMVYSLEKLSKAFQRLKESTEKAINELEKDGVIQRFEFTFELFWKTIKIILENEGFRCAGPRSCIKEGKQLSQKAILSKFAEIKNKLSGTDKIWDETYFTETIS